MTTWIERKIWREMHANVTINHRCRRIEELMNDVVYYLMSHNRKAKLGVRDLRPAILFRDVCDVI